MSAQLMQTIAPGWRRVEAPRFKKDYPNSYVTASDFSAIRLHGMSVPPDGAVCRVERRYKEATGQETQLLLMWRCPHCGLRCHVSAPESWITDDRLVFVEPEEKGHDDRA